MGYPIYIVLTYFCKPLSPLATRVALVAELSEAKLPRFFHGARAELFRTYFPFIAELKSRSHNAECKPPNFCTPILFLICSPFTEEEETVRTFLQSAIPSLLTTNGGLLLTLLFAHYDENVEAALSSPRRKPSKKRKELPSPKVAQPHEVVDSYFKLFDFLMAKFSPIANPDAAYGTSSPYNTASAQTTAASTFSATAVANNEDVTTSKLSALSVLGLLSIRSNPSADPTSRVLPLLFEASLCRVIKFWLDYELEMQAFKTITTIHENINFTELFSIKGMHDHASIFVSVVRELLLTFEDDVEPNQFYFLHSFMKEFIYDHSSQSVDGKSKYLSSATQYLYPGFVVEQDLLCMRRWAKYVFRVTEAERLTGDSGDEFFKSLVKKNLPYLTAKVLLVFEMGPIVFLLRSVLHDKHELQFIIKHHARAILKILIDSLGEKHQNRADVIEKIKFAAVWHYRESEKITKRQNSDTSQQSTVSSVRPLKDVDVMINMAKENKDSNAVGSRGSMCSSEDKERAAKIWVKPHVMFLLHGAMSGYKNKDTEQKARTMFCINGIIGFLMPSDAARFMPKILSCVNIGMSDSSHDPKLRYFALKNLISFVKVLCDGE